jgi:anaerobic magnesium-protoporphyrin IX monomethyl ester cyclase
MDYEVIRREFSFEAYLPPLGLLYIASPLEKQGHKIELIDFVAEQFTEKKLMKALVKIDVVCITVTSQIVTSASKITELIKNFNPKIKVIIGGPHCTIQKKEALNEIKADISVTGDGEEVILDIVDALNGKKKLSKVHGIFYREKDTIKKGLPAVEIEDLDSIDFPSWHLIRKYNYGKEALTGVTTLARGKITSIMTTRGCPFNCRFCVSKSIFKNCRLRSADNVVKELEEISKDFDTVFAVDDNFLMDKKRAHEIMDALIKKKLDLDIWIAGIRVTDADKELFKKMKQAGVKSLEFGIESGNQEVLDYYNKKITLEKVKRAVKLSKKTGFLTIGNIIFGAPIETDKHIEDSLKFVKKLNLDFAFFYGFNFLKGSDIWEDAFKAGRIRENEMFRECDSKSGLGNYTPEELRNKIQHAFKSYYFNPKYILSQFFRSLFVYGNFRFLTAGLKLIFEQRENTILARR